MVHEGKDGWLFLIGGTNSVIDLYQHKSSFTEEHVKAWADLITTRAAFAAEVGADYQHLAAPEKLTVMHKYFAGDIENIGNSPINQMHSKCPEIRKHFINVLPLYERQQDDFLLFWKTDTHWSFVGCFSAYQQLCARLGVASRADLLQYPFGEAHCLLDLGAKMTPERREDVRFYRLAKDAHRVYANPMVRFKEEQKLLNENSLHIGSHVVYRNESDKAVDKCVVLFGDSFSEYRPHLLMGMLAETFCEVHFIWNAAIDREYVALLRPDILVTELAERFMVSVPTDQLCIQTFSAERLAKFQRTQQITGKAA